MRLSRKLSRKSVTNCNFFVHHAPLFATFGCFAEYRNGFFEIIVEIVVELLQKRACPGRYTLFVVSYSTLLKNSCNLGFLG